MTSVNVNSSETEKKRGPGRPGVGSATNIRLGDELTKRVDAAKENGESRAATIRRLVELGLDSSYDFDITATELAAELNTAHHGVMEAANQLGIIDEMGARPAAAAGHEFQFTRLDADAIREHFAAPAEG